MLLFIHNRALATTSECYCLLTTEPYSYNINTRYRLLTTEPYSYNINTCYCLLSTQPYCYNINTLILPIYKRALQLYYNCRALL